MSRRFAFRLRAPAWLPCVTALVLAGCRPASNPPADPPSASTTAGPEAPHGQSASLGYLIASASDDFRANAQGSIQVRNVRFGLRDTTGGQEAYVLCGEFRSATGDTAQWVPFATVETSKYEQWLGETRFCQTVLGAWNSSDSLTARLQRALN